MPPSSAPYKGGHGKVTATQQPLAFAFHVLAILNKTAVTVLTWNLVYSFGL